MIELDENYRKKYEEAVKRAEENPEEERLRPVSALNTLLQEIGKKGLMEMIDLDPYFGEVSLPLKEQTDLLTERYPEEFAFFKTLMEDLQEEIEIHFEVTEMYEDEEFDQFVEDTRIIKARYSEDFRREHLPKMKALVQKVVDDLG
ncbi:hypothetical protein [Hydrogenimonas sp.]